MWSSPRLVIVLALGLAGSAGAGARASSASGSVPIAPPTASPQEKQLAKTCIVTVQGIQKALAEAATTRVKAVRSSFVVDTPGALAGEIAFNRSARSITLAGPKPPPGRAGEYGCSEAAAGGRGLGPGRSRVVSTLRRTFTTPGHYTLTFTLNQTGRRLLAQLAAAEQTYRRQHPHGTRPPSLAFGVSLDYAPSG